MKIGIAGHGAIGARHAENARNLGHEVKVYDPQNIRDFNREHLLYDWCDAAVVSTPSLWHEGPLRACIERGKHALVEKPISMSVGMLPELLRTAKEKKLTVMVGNNLRFHPCVQKIKEWIENKSALGKILWANFICSTLGSYGSLREGAIFNTGGHEVDLALYLFGTGAVGVAHAQYRDPAPVDIMSDFVIRHHNGIRTTMHLDLVSPHRVRQFWIAGEKENLRVDLDARMILSTKEGAPNDVLSFSGHYDDDYVAEMKAFIDRIEGKATPGATAEQALAVLKLLVAIRAKADSSS